MLANSWVLPSCCGGQVIAVSARARCAQAIAIAAALAVILLVGPVWAVEIDGRLVAAAQAVAKRGDAPTAAISALIVGPEAATVAARLRAKGLAVRYSAGVGRVRLGATQLKVLAGPERARVVPPARLYPMLDLSLPAIGINAGIRAERSGRDVLVAILDTGIDFTHPDFLHPDGSTRIVAYWDQTAEPDGSAPYGLICDANDIDLGRCPNRADEPFETFLPLGHGTHVAGIAAGDDTVYTGVAPEALIVGVRLNFDELGLIDALDWVAGLAAAWRKPVVVNLSLGANEGPHDGSAPSEAAIDALSGPGYVVVTAAGNEAPTASGGGLIHVRFVPGSGNRARFAPAGLGTVSEFGLEVWADADVDFTAGLALEFGGGSSSLGTVYDTTPDWSPTQLPAAGEEVILTSGGSNVVRVSAIPLATARAHGIRMQIQRLNDSLAGFDFHLAVTGHDAPVDAWLTDRIAYFADLSGPATLELAEGGSLDVTWQPGDAERIVTLPGNGNNSLTVAAFVSRNTWEAINGNRYTSGSELGAIVDVSGAGPTRDGRMKPDLAAPGEFIASSRASTNGLATDFLSVSTTHTLQRGTSMAAPHVAGVVALILEGRPDASSDDLRALLTAAAVSDAATGNVPNTRWGAGKLNMAAVVTAPLWLQTESPDTMPPAITGAALERRSDGLWVTWWTDELATSELDYDDGRSGGRQSFSLYHEVLLDSPGSRVTLRSRDPRGNLSQPLDLVVSGGGCGVARTTHGAPLMPVVLLLLVIYRRLRHSVLFWRPKDDASRSRSRSA